MAVAAAAFRVFLAEKVDVAILEVGLGGRLDATNCVPQPVVCGISALGYDHMELLGNTLSVCQDFYGIIPGRIGRTPIVTRVRSCLGLTKRCCRVAENRT